MVLVSNSRKETGDAGCRWSWVPSLGTAKRNNVLSDYTFAVRDRTTGKLLPIGKAYSGYLTDMGDCRAD